LIFLKNKKTNFQKRSKEKKCGYSLFIRQKGLTIRPREYSGELCVSRKNSVLIIYKNHEVVQFE